MNYRVLKHH